MKNFSKKITKRIGTSIYNKDIKTASTEFTGLKKLGLFRDKLLASIEALIKKCVIRERINIVLLASKCPVYNMAKRPSQTFTFIKHFKFF
jgi:hypothetical protein